MASKKENNPNKERLSQLHARRSEKKAAGKFYSRFVRFMRLFLPIIAIGIIAVLMAWPDAEKIMSPIPKEAILPQTIGKNEVISPRFESKDDKQQPFTITAERAVQDTKDPDIVFLERPAADITLQSGAWLAITSLKGAYRQHDERLLLEGNVELFHDAGYQFQTEKLLVNLDTGKAFAETAVEGSGPAGTLSATAMQANNAEGILIFKGPAKLVLNRSIKGL